MSGFTPGPWQMSGCRYKWRHPDHDQVLDSHAVGPDSDPVCLVFYTSKYHAEQLANARLIAAAPDLLDLAKDMAAFVKHWQDDGLCNLKPTPESLATAAERLRAAIAKATGAA